MHQHIITSFIVEVGFQTSQSEQNDIISTRIIVLCISTHFFYINNDKIGKNNCLENYIGNMYILEIKMFLNSFIIPFKF